MSGLTAADRTKLAKLLSLLGSDQLGERDAAASAAQRFVTQRGLTWSDVLDPASAENRPPQQGCWRATVRACLECSEAFGSWELQFLRGLLRFRVLSPKQQAILERIAQRLLGDGS